MSVQAGEIIEGKVAGQYECGVALQSDGGTPKAAVTLHVVAGDRVVVVEEKNISSAQVASGDYTGAAQTYKMLSPALGAGLPVLVLSLGGATHFTVQLAGVNVDDNKLTTDPVFADSVVTDDALVADYEGHDIVAQGIGTCNMTINIGAFSGVLPVQVTA